MPSEKLLVTGASGFVGGFLLEALFSAGYTEIVALHHRPLRNDTQKYFGGFSGWLQKDLTCGDLTEILTGVHTVFHLAARASVNESDADRQMMERVNVDGTRRLAEACKVAGVRHFIFVSSIAACEGGVSPEINETTGHPVSTYGKTKKAAEEVVLSLAGKGFEVTVLRPTALFGEHHRGSVYELVKMIRKGRFMIFGAGDNRTNFYYIRDFVDVLMKVLNNPQAYGQVWIAADAPYPLRQLVNWIVDELGEGRKIPRVPEVLGAVLAGLCDGVSWLTGRPLPLSRRRFRAMVRDVAYSNQELVRTLKLHPAYGVKAGLKRSIEWYRKAGLL